MIVDFKLAGDDLAAWGGFLFGAQEWGFMMQRAAKARSQLMNRTSKLLGGPGVRFVRDLSEAAQDWFVKPRGRRSPAIDWLAGTIAATTFAEHMGPRITAERIKAMSDQLRRTMAANHIPGPYWAAWNGQEIEL